jgi:hypothetical protein
MRVGTNSGGLPGGGGNALDNSEAVWISIARYDDWTWIGCPVKILPGGENAHSGCDKVRRASARQHGPSVLSVFLIGAEEVTE